MNEDTILRAKYKFLSEYSTKISDIGYSLSAIVAWRLEDSKDYGTIEARISSEENLSSSIKKQIEDIIPKAYLYWGEKIPIRLSYIGIGKQH